MFVISRVEEKDLEFPDQSGIERRNLKQFQTIIKSCLQRDVSQRVTAEELVRAFSSLQLSRMEAFEREVKALCVGKRGWTVAPPFNTAVPNNTVAVNVIMHTR